ncbi:MAG: amidohydrolase family protein [Pseudomonadota bacterium]
MQRVFCNRSRSVGRKRRPRLPSQRTSANAAAIKAFVVNRVGDFGFALGIFALFALTGSINFDVIFAEAPLLADHGLHIQMLLHADKHIKGLAEDIRALPVALVIDHCGWPLNLNPDTAAIDTLCALMSEGHVYVKLSAPYRLTRDITEAAPLMPRLLAANPERCLWGSDWPHIMLGDAHMPHAATLADQITGFTDVDTQKQIFVDNPNRLFMP